MELNIFPFPNLKLNLSFFFYSSLRLLLALTLCYDAPRGRPSTQEYRLFGSSINDPVMIVYPHRGFVFVISALSLFDFDSLTFDVVRGYHYSVACRSCCRRLLEEEAGKRPHSRSGCFLT